jgi:hypothetical protein
VVWAGTESAYSGGERRNARWLGHRAFRTILSSWP